MRRGVVATCLAVTLLTMTAPVLAGEIAIGGHASAADADEATSAAERPCERRPAHARVTYTSPVDGEETATYGIFISVFRPGPTSLDERSYLRFVTGPNRSTDLCVRVTPIESAVVFVEAIHTSKAKFDSGHFGTLFVQSLGYFGPMDLKLHDSGIASLAVSGSGR